MEAMVVQKSIDKLGAHPLLRAYVRRSETARRDGAEVGPKNTEAWHALAEKYAAAILCFGSMQEGQGGIEWTGPVRDDVRPGVLGARIAAATPYLWRWEMFETARSAPLPPHVIAPNFLPMPSMFWSWETGITTDFGTNDWVAVLSDANGVDMVWNTDAGDRTPAVTLNHIRFLFGQAWPRDFAGKTEQREMAELLLKFCAFLNSSFVEAEPERMRRHLRRQISRSAEHVEQADEPISVVRLRREVPTANQSGDSEVLWRHHWWVGGHYRAQWYPSIGAHKVIWIAPHLKGPSDMPLLERIYSVER